MQITINLASRPFLDFTKLVNRLRIATAWLGVVSLGVVILFVMSQVRHNSLRAEAHLLDRKIDRESTELRGYKGLLQKSDNFLLADRTAALNQLFDEKAFSWTLLMKDLEGILPPQVQMATIQPIREKDGSISIQIHLLGPRARAVEFLQNLEASSSFVQPRVLAENAQDDARGTAAPSALSDSSMEEFDIVAGFDMGDPSGLQPPVESTPDAQIHPVNAAYSSGVTKGAQTVASMATRATVGRAEHRGAK